MSESLYGCGCAASGVVKRSRRLCANVFLKVFLSDLISFNLRAARSAAGFAKGRAGSLQSSTMESSVGARRGGGAGAARGQESQ
jgi:hypothetical protein